MEGGGGGWEDTAREQLRISLFSSNTNNSITWEKDYYHQLL